MFANRVMRPENGAESRKKTTVKWASVDPEFNEQVKINIFLEF